MVQSASNFTTGIRRAPLLCGAVVYLLATGISFGDPVSDLPPKRASETAVPAIPSASEVVFPLLTIEEIVLPQLQISVVPEPNTPAEAVAPERPVQKQPAEHAGVLSSARQFALGMIETGNNDSAVGGLGEVSRYQIMPSVWKAYSQSSKYRDIDAATEVAQKHWTSLYEYFKKKTDREPTDFDMYVLWNTRYGYYSAKGFEPARLHPVVRDRAQRFANLVEDSQRRASELEMAALRQG